MTPPPSEPTPLESCLNLLTTIPDEELEPWHVGHRNLKHIAEYTRMMLEELISSGDVNARDEDENSALYHARFCPRLLAALLAAGCSPAACREEEVAELLDCRLTAETMQMLLDAGANPNVKDWDFATPLHDACDSNAVEHVRLLLAHGADPAALWWDGRTTLFYAKSAEVAEMLLAAGADVNAEDIDYFRPLHEANAEVTRVLLAHGAEVQVTQLFGETPLDLAEDEGKIRLLKAAGARSGKGRKRHS